MGNKIAPTVEALFTVAASGPQREPCLSVYLLPGGVDYFCSATNRRSRAASRSIFAPPRTALRVIDPDFDGPIASSAAAGFN